HACFVFRTRESPQNRGFLDLLPIDISSGFCPNWLTSAKLRRLSRATGTRFGIAAILSKIVGRGIRRRKRGWAYKFFVCAFPAHLENAAEQQYRDQDSKIFGSIGHGGQACEAGRRGGTNGDC